MKLIKLTALALLTLFVSCEQEITPSIEHTEANLTTSTTVQNRGVTGTIIRNRTKLKQRKNSRYRSTIVVNDPTNNVAAVEVQMLPMNHVYPSPATYTMEHTGNEGENKKFKFNTLHFENGEANGWPFKQVATAVDANGEPVGDTLEQWVTAQDNDGVDNTSVSVKRAANQEEFIIQATYVTENEGDITSARFFFNEIEGVEYSIKEKTTPVEASVTTNGETGTTEVTLEVRVTISYETANGQKPFVDGQAVGVNIEVRNAAGEVMDDDLFNVDIEDEEAYTFKNFKHKTTPTKVFRIRGQVLPAPTSGAPTANAGPANNLTMTIPENVTNQGAYTIVLNAKDGTDGTVFVGRLKGVEEIPAGTTYTSLVKAFDENGKEVASKEITITVEAFQQPEGIEIQNHRLKRNEGEDTYTLRTRIIGENRADVAMVDVFLTPLDGGAEADPEEFDSYLVNTTEYNKTFKNKTVEFDDPDGVVGMQYSVEYALINAAGDDIGYIEAYLYAVE
ncbi:hypothetical protein [Ulvibacter litoralis]|uniref:Uncharacterized protein n=1 Tax=Ulvibacter litoralis TaxID=227084 RepID=A0A1G7FHS9_9FLAO|nr:hypothetical protein [Ulvibacter litoralis]GHC51041.1 hypothetical protein GCM10008083_13370 [Ulvibacter litoralis]SDE75412.1 hypothetical protein SAMN05421855_102570 [Ulvibacter litoralis]